MNPRLQRALLLIEQGRHGMAEQELRHSLAEQPNDATSHAALALCLAQREQYVEASQEAAAAIHAAPDQAFGFYAQAHVFRKRNRLPEAEQSIQQAIALAPDDSAYYALAGALYLEQHRWQQALDMAEEGLAFDPENVDCSNIRARALNQLGRPNDARDAMAESLSRAPENATTHALLGWTLLEKGQYQTAMEHFREALRLEPEMELARSGIVEALKAKRVLYRPILKYFLWITKFGGRGQWAIVVGLWVVANVLRRMADANPALDPWVTPITVLYAVFAFSTWMAVPLFNLMLFLDPFGRLALSRNEKVTAGLVGICVAGAIVSLVGYFAVGGAGFLPAAVVCGLLIPPISQVFNCESGWPRMAMTALAAVLLFVGIFGVLGVSLGGDGELRSEKIVRGLGNIAMLAFVIGAIGSQFAANYFANVRVRH